MIKNNEMDLLDYLEEHRTQEIASFHMPGHKGKAFFEKYGYGKVLMNLVDYDITEITGADNLFKAETIIKNLMTRYAKLYGVKNSYLLVNGTTSGILASLLTVLNENEKIIIASNSHQSVSNGIFLAKAKKVVVDVKFSYPFINDGEILAEDIEKAIIQNPKAKAVLITSPNYYGVVSNINKISEVVHKANMILIVDQAHGSHLPFFKKDFAAECQGADIVINSPHKTMGAFTQCGLLNVCSDRVDRFFLERNLQIIQSSSPSYLFLTSFAMNLEIMENYGVEIIREWKTNIETFLDKITYLKNLEVLQLDNLDKSKINIFAKKTFDKIVDGNFIVKFLENKGIFLEMSFDKIALGMSGIGSQKEDYENLFTALLELDEIIENKFDSVESLEALDVLRIKSFNDDNIGLKVNNLLDSKKKVLRLKKQNIDIKEEQKFYKECFFSFKQDFVDFENDISDTKTKVNCNNIERLHYTKAVNRILAVNITPYPPGIPILTIGEICEADKLQIAYELVKLGQNVMGMDSYGNVSVYKLNH